MLLPRRPRAALARDRAARTFSQGPCAAGWRLVAARPGQGKGRHAATGALATWAVQPCALDGSLAPHGAGHHLCEPQGLLPCWILPQISPMTDRHRGRRRLAGATTGPWWTPIPMP